MKIINREPLKPPFSVTVLGAFVNPYSDNYHVVRELRDHPYILKVNTIDYRRLLNTNPHEFIHQLQKAKETTQLIIICKGNSIPVKIIKELSRDVRIYYFMPDVYSHFRSNPKMLEYTKYCDYRSATGYGTVSEWYENIKLPVYHLINGTNTRIFNDNSPSYKPLFDICFVGGYDAERDRIYRHIKDKGYKVGFFGPGFTSYTTPERTANIYRQSKIVLNISRGNYEGYTSMRLWNIMACGSFALTKKIESIHLLGLEDGVHLASWSDTNDLHNKIDYYLNHPEEREKIAKAGQDFTLKNRTWKTFVAGLVRIVTTSKGCKYE